MQNLLVDLKLLLEQDERFVSEGKLLKNTIIEAALKLDKDLLRLLLTNSTIKNHFFVDIDEVMVFDKNKFQKFVNNKAFLPDSYTAFKNKIGLTVNDVFISENREVVLSWPYKDCILEGGQTKEDEKRDEIFWNEILAPDEIDRLLSPKVFTNFLKYDKDGNHKVTELTKHDNLLIKGNNLIILNSLLEVYKKQIKLIYIDPPYNTGDDDFNYNDSFTCSSWLTFMKNRLEIAYGLLAEDGLIFVQINSSKNTKNNQYGTSQLPYLNVLMDEIFKKKNFIAHLHWKKKKQPSFLAKTAGIMESILVYAKNESQIQPLRLGTTSDSTKRIDNSSNKLAVRSISKGIVYMGEKDCTIAKGIYQNKTMQTEFLEDVIIKGGKVTNDFTAKAKFRNTQDEINRFCQNDLLYITKKNSFRRFILPEETNVQKTITDLLLDWGQNQDATNELRDLFNITNDDKAFDNPKPELLLHNIIACCTKPGDLVLDFFAGSGTTGAVAHKIDRRYILIEQMDYIDYLTKERLLKVIAGEQGGVSSIAEWNGGGSFVYLELAKANECFIQMINASKNSDDCINIWLEMKDKAIINYRIPNNVQFENELGNLCHEEGKRLLIELLDKNMLYIPISEIEDESWNIKDDDKDINNNFYKMI